jgi:two-component SAPR family response regulator
MNEGLPKVLIIDDDPGVLFLHEIIVTESHLHQEPQVFSKAEDALSYLIPLDSEACRVLIFLDINMPTMNGWQFLEQLEKQINHSDIKVIMVTSSLSRSEREKSKSYSLVIDFWEKPMEEGQVYQLIDRLGSWLKKG